jgi:hypothetical protein
MQARIRRLFLEHPASVGESYLEHAAHSAGFGVAMITGALAAFLHAAVPRFCTTTGSRIVARLYDRMVVNRTLILASRSTSSSQPEFIAEHI